jgi:AraC-like DNA-binding protein
MFDETGHGRTPDYTGKSVAVIGGGNVAMDAARSARRCGAKDVTIVYRRRSDDMTALPAEVEASVADGIELMTLQAPVKVEKDTDGNCAGLWVQPQMIGPCRGGRPAPLNNASKAQFMIPCEVLLIAVGQDIVSKPWEDFGIPAKWNILQAGLDTQVKEIPGVFTGGDCATGPSTVIRAIAAGKVAAHNIDEYLGYHHTLDCGVTAPEARMNNRIPTGRVNIQERPANERKHDFEYVELPLTPEEIAQECYYSKSHFMKFFKETMGMSFTQYLNDYRLNIAGQTLRSTTDNISNIAQNTGFDNLSYFTRMFKKKYGLTPGEYRKATD